jgi:hypothetical protein
LSSKFRSVNINILNLYKIIFRFWIFFK